MGSSTQRLLLQQVGLTVSGAYAAHVPGEPPLRQKSVAQYWARRLASAAQQTFFASVWRAGYHFHWTVARTALTYVQTPESATFSSAVAGALSGLQEQLGEMGVACASFNEWQEVQPRDEQQARRIGCLVQRCRSFASDPVSMWAEFMQDGTWYQLMTRVVVGLDEAFSHLPLDPASPFPTSPLSRQSGISELLCGWYLDVGMSAPEQAQVIVNAVAELAERGYRDVSDLVRPYYDGKFDYLCVLQQPDGSPLYCRTASEVFALLEVARREHPVGTPPCS